MQASRIPSPPESRIVTGSGARHPSLKERISAWQIPVVLPSHRDRLPSFAGEGATFALPEVAARAPRSRRVAEREQAGTVYPVPGCSQDRAL